MSILERSVVILGPLSTTTQSLVMGLTQLGADVSLVDQDAVKYQKFAENVSSQREANSKFGRCVAIPADLKSDNGIKDGVSKAAQVFGSVDIFIDAMLLNKPSPFNLDQNLTAIDEIISNNLAISVKAAHVVAPFLKSRKRGRILFMMNESVDRAHIPDAVGTAARGGLQFFSKSLARQLQEYNVTVNTLSLGLSEEYLLGHFPECGSIKEAVEKMKHLDPLFRLAEPEKIAQSVLFLVGQSGSSISGQHLRLS
jgi:2-hydroxycyclohexanecarboxyl-CoA dehydrogenase